MEILIKYILLALSLFVMEWIYMKIATRFHIVDIPKARSSHTVPTIRGGGVIIYVAAVAHFVFSGWDYPLFMMGLTIIAVISFWDDISSIPPWLKLILYTACVALMMSQYHAFEHPWYYTIPAVVICMGVLNAFNFMDGVNGMTVGYSMVLLLTLIYMDRHVIWFMKMDFLLVAFIAVVVFGFFNFRNKALCFMGDVGAFCIASVVLFAFGTMMLATRNFSYVCFLGVYGVDVCMTLLRRILLKQPILQAHRMHAYQILANEMKMPHLVVTGLYMAAQTLIIVGYFVFANGRSIHRAYALGVLALLVLAYILIARKYVPTEKLC